MSQLSLLAPLAGEAMEPPTGESDEWYTPAWVFGPLDRLFRFDLDVCATKESKKCERFFDLYADGLTQSWATPFIDEQAKLGAAWWCNPPYSNIEPWVRKGLSAAADGFPGVMLLPNWSDRAWWQELVEPRRDRDRMDPRAPGGVALETRLTKRISFGYPGNPEGLESIRKADLARYKAEGKKGGPEGPKIYPVFLAFIPPRRFDLAGLIRQYEPEWAAAA